MKNLNQNGGEITMQILLMHMQKGFADMDKKFTRLINKVDIKVDNLERKMDNGFSNLNDRLLWMESHDIPERVSRLEDKVFAGVDS